MTLAGSEILAHPYFSEEPTAAPTLTSLMQPGPILLHLNGPSDCSYFPRKRLEDRGKGVDERPAWWPSSAGSVGNGGNSSSVHNDAGQGFERPGLSAKAAGSEIETVASPGAGRGSGGAVWLVPNGGMARNRSSSEGKPPSSDEKDDFPSFTTVGSMA